MLREEPLVAVGLLPGLVAVIRELQTQTSGEGAASGLETGVAGGRAFDPGSGVVDGSPVTDRRELLGLRTALRGVPLFSMLPDRQVRRIERQFTVRRYGKDRVLVRSGAGGSSFYLLLEGRVQVEARDGSPRRPGPGSAVRGTRADRRRPARGHPDVARPGDGRRAAAGVLPASAEERTAHGRPAGRRPRGAHPAAAGAAHRLTAAAGHGPGTGEGRRCLRTAGLPGRERGFALSYDSRESGLTSSRAYRQAYRHPSRRRPLQACRRRCTRW